MKRKGYVLLAVVLALALAVLYMTGVRMYDAVAVASDQSQTYGSVTAEQDVSGVAAYKFDVQLTAYTVKAGDTLWLVAVRNRTTVDSVKALNRLRSDIIYPGQKLTVPGLVTVSGAQPAPQQPPNSSAQTEAYEILRLVNAERAKAGLAPLALDAGLSRVAQEKARDMADSGYFSHTSPTYGSPFDMMRQFGISFSYAGENIAKGYPTPAAVMEGWMESPGHRANILNPNFTHIGVGVKDRVWVQMFVKPR